MKPGKLVAVLFCLVLLLTGAAAARAEEGRQNVIQVSGEGIVEAAPDQADLLLAVITEATDAREAQAENARKTARVIKALKERGIPEENIQTRGYHLSPKYSLPRKPEVGPVAKETISPGVGENVKQIVGYTVHHQIKVRVKNLDEVGELMDLAVKNGANQISNVTFSVSNSLEFKKKALLEAVAEARAKAEVLAAALGKTLTGIKSASGSWYENNPGPVYYKEMSLQAGGAPAATPVVPGMVEIRAHVNIVYTIEQ